MRESLQMIEGELDVSGGPQRKRVLAEGDVDVVVLVALGQANVDIALDNMDGR